MLALGREGAIEDGGDADVGERQGGGAAGDGVLLADVEKATARSNSLAVHTFVAATYVKLGFKVNGVSSVTFYVNGVPNATTIGTTNIPIVGLTPSYSVHATGTDQAVMDIDWVRVAQLR